MSFSHVSNDVVALKTNTILLGRLTSAFLNLSNLEQTVGRGGRVKGRIS